MSLKYYVSWGKQKKMNERIRYLKIKFHKHTNSKCQMREKLGRLRLRVWIISRYRFDEGTRHDYCIRYSNNDFHICWRNGKRYQNASVFFARKVFEIVLFFQCVFFSYLPILNGNINKHTMWACITGGKMILSAD